MLSCKQGSSKQHHCLEQLKVLPAAAAELFFDYGSYQFKTGQKRENKVNYMPLHISSTVKFDFFLNIKIPILYLVPSGHLFQQLKAHQ